jgi:acylphosphatase
MSTAPARALGKEVDVFSEALPIAILGVMPMRCERFLVSGRVQGVGFRYWTVRQADELGLEGYVRNLPDGTVEVVASGAEKDVEALARLCARGPWGARVDDVNRQACRDYIGSGSGFRIRH